MTNPLFLSVVLLSSPALASASIEQQPARPGEVPQAHAEQVAQPLLFQKNLGQFDESVRYAARGAGYNVVIGERPVIQLFDRRAQATGRAHELALQVDGAAQEISTTALGATEVSFNYLVGQQAEWKTNVPAFDRVRQHGVLPGVDMDFYGVGGRLEYDFVVAPGTDPDSIRYRLDGADEVSLNADGALVIRLGNDKTIVQKPPVSYQVSEQGERRMIASAYRLDEGWIEFDLGEYDTGRTLVIDPILEYSAYYGGERDDQIAGVGVDASDNIYIIAETQSAGLSTTVGFGEDNPTPARSASTFTLFCDGCEDELGNGQVERTEIRPAPAGAVLVSKFSPDGMTLLQASYIANADGDQLRVGLNSTAVSATGEVAIGITSAAPDGLPLVSETLAYDASQANVYLARLNSSGDGLVFSTYLPLSPAQENRGWVRGVDIADDGSVAATGYLGSFDASAPQPIFPTVNPITGQSCDLIDRADFTNGDFTQYWLAYFDSNGTLTFSSCFGGRTRPSNGSYIESGRGVRIAANGLLYVLGYSATTDFPTAGTPYQSQPSVTGYRDATVSAIDPTTSEFVYSTYVGPSGEGVALRGTSRTVSSNFPLFIDLDGAGNVVIGGGTNNTRLASAGAAQPNLAYSDTLDPNLDPQNLYGIDFDNYVAKLDGTLSNLLFATYYGGTGAERWEMSGVSDDQGNTYVQTVTYSDDLPLVNEIQSSKTADSALAIAKFTPAGALAFSTYLGPTDAGEGVSAVAGNVGGIAVNSAGRVVSVSDTVADSWPVTGNMATRNGRRDMVVSIIGLDDLVDTDGDGISDNIDAFANNAAEWLDTDGDTLGNNTDTDDDGDTVADVDDAFPLQASKQTDTDFDAVADGSDAFPTDPSEAFDLDNNGIGDFGENDSDKDGLANRYDFRPFNPQLLLDTDGDGIADSLDDDRDGDGVVNASDAQPTNFDSPFITFNGFRPSNTTVYKSPLPVGFSAVAGNDKPWTAATDQFFQVPGETGATSLGSLPIADGETSSVQYTGEFADTTLSFYYRVDSEAGADVFSFSVDGVEVLSDSGLVDWTQYSTTISPGEHTLVWRYSKDGQNSDGADGAWIDRIGGAPDFPVDLAIEIELESTVLNGGQPAIITVRLVNNSQVATAASQFQLGFPAGLSNLVWSCTTSSGAPCVPQNSTVTQKSSGTGDINDTLDFAAGETLTYTISADVTATEGAPLEFTGGISTGGGVTDADPSNNNLSLKTKVGIFGSRFQETLR